jgi:hypothetical protein
MFCPSCGAEYNQHLKFCNSCGANLHPRGNTVEISIAKPPIVSMAWATILFSFIGGIISLLLLVWSLTGGFTGYKESRLATASVVCFLFTCTVALLLVRQIGRLIGVYNDSIKQMVNREVETDAPAKVALPQQQPVSVPAVKEPLSSVTDATTRSL